MERERPVALSIAGFDPSGGAGVLADIKTFEQCGVMGFGVCSALTFQNEKECNGVDWIPQHRILHQIIPLLGRYRIQAVKIGLIESVSVIQHIIGYMRLWSPGVRFIWDPVMRASAGFVFHESLDQSAIEKVLPELHLITPNIHEVTQLSPHASSPQNAATSMAKSVNVLLKGGHAEGTEVCDTLYSAGHAKSFKRPRQKDSKHGTGCVLSAAITAHLAKGAPLERACELGEGYITKFLQSSSSLLGVHHSDTIKRDTDAKDREISFPHA